MTRLEQQLNQLPSSVKDRLGRHAFDRSRFLALAKRLQTGAGIDNHVQGSLHAPQPSDIHDLPSVGSAAWQRLTEIGLGALRRGEVAMVVLAGGMATRMGGVVKALVEALPGQTFLDLRLGEMAALEAATGHRPPLWLMTSAATDAAIRSHLGDRLDGDRVAAFVQSLSLRLRPNGELYLDETGHPSEHAPGHGDLPEALTQSGLLDRFIQRGGRSVMVTNLDNLGASLDPAVIGFHLEHGALVSAEVVDKLGSDRGGIPVRLDDRVVILEEFRIPDTFDPATVRVFNVNTFWFDARALRDLELDWTFFRVEKKLGNERVIQFERLINEVTFALETRYLRVPRTGSASRFLPVKDTAELEARRAEILAVAEARRMIVR